MVRSRAARRYAQALFKEAKEKDRLEPVGQDLKQIEKIYQQSPEFRQLVSSPVIPEKVKKQSVTDAFKEMLDSVTFNFLILLVEKGREALLLDIINHFNRILDEHLGIVRGQVLSVVPLSDDHLEDLKRKLDVMMGKNVILTQERDESLLGGFVVKIDDRVIDASLRNQINRMGEYLIKAD